MKVSGTEALLQRVLMKLTARRGEFLFMENFGSRLWQLSRVNPAARKTAAVQYAAEALEGENISVEDVLVEDGGNGVLTLQVYLKAEDEMHALHLAVR